MLDVGLNCKLQPMRVFVLENREEHLKQKEEMLSSAGYNFVGQTELDSALAYLSQDSMFDTILLDKAFGRNDGLDVVCNLKKDNQLKDIPVILQAEAPNADLVLKGIEAGVFRYLRNPNKPKEVLATVRQAIEESWRVKDQERMARAAHCALKQSMYGAYQFQTQEQVRELAFMLSYLCPEPERVVVGLLELMNNAVEHGNLDIGYELKGQLLLENAYQMEMQRRLEDPRYGKKKAVVQYERLEHEISFLIYDEGNGFDWHAYSRVDATTLTGLNGRGMFLAKSMAFDSLTYQGCGNSVQAVILR